jgi:hypothetical protein
MAEISSSTYSETDASNTTVSGVNIAEGCPPSGMNNMGRAILGLTARALNMLTGKYASTGSSNAYVLTPSAALGAYVTGGRYSFRANFSNTGAATLNISSLGAKTIKKYTASGKADLAADDIRSGQPVTVEYDGTDLVMVTPVAEGNINGLTEDTAPVGSTDFVASYDASVSANKKVSIDNLNKGWVLVTSQSASSSATIDFTGLGDTYDHYMIVLDNVKPATDDAVLTLRVGTGGTPTYQATGYTYGGRTSGPSGGADIGSTTDSITTQIPVTRQGGGAGTGIGNATGEHASGRVLFSNPEASDFPLFEISSRYVNSSGVLNGVTNSGMYGSAGAFTAVRFLMSSGNISSGTFRLYGLRK